ncbi:hypothetical protein ACJJTC_017127 [Scirpophaga incertulas]
METNKENMRIIKSKIPLPIQPLPPIPKSLLQPSKTGKEKNERCPLRTITPEGSLSLPGPSKKLKSDSKTIDIDRTDTRYVTIRNTDEHLDWDFKVFKDELSDGENIVSDCGDENKATSLLADKNQISCVDGSKATTPALSSLQSNKVKNIKRSLKRPHSRELQGLSPLNEERKYRDRMKSEIRLFPEPLKERLKPLDELKKSYANSVCQNHARDALSYLLAAERKSLTPGISNVARACVINWLMKVNGADGYPATIQTAIWYLDSVLGLSEVALDKLQLIGAASYWIANKLHGAINAARYLVKCSNQAFSASDLRQAEKEILLKLNFPLLPVVPQEFIDYLSFWCDNSNPGEIEVAATFICMSGLMLNKNLSAEYASVVGAAAVREAVLLLKKRELIPHLETSPVFQEALKKTTNFCGVCSSLRKAAKGVASPKCEFRNVLKLYGAPPYYIAHRVVKSISTDARLL